MIPRLYLDLDGVFADFDQHYENLFGGYHKGLSDDVLWGNINRVPDFFATMPIFEGGKDFFEEATAWRYRGSGYIKDVAILTACPKDDYARVASQKRQWVYKNLSPDITVLPTAGGGSKPLFMHSQGDILIDDFVRNTTAWEAAGGRPILHVPSDFQGTADVLQKLLGV